MTAFRQLSNGYVTTDSSYVVTVCRGLPVDRVETNSLGQPIAWKLLCHKYVLGGIMKRKFMLPALLAALLATTAFFAPTARAQAAAPRRIDIVSKRFSFDPGEITLKKGEPVVLVLKSADVAHGLRFRDLNVNIKVNAGGTAEAQQA